VIARMAPTPAAAAATPNLNRLFLDMFGLLADISLSPPGKGLD